MSGPNVLEGAIGALNKAMLDDAQWPWASSVIDEAIGSKGSMLTFGEDHPGGSIEIYFSRCFSRGVDRSDWQREYFRDYHARDEHLPRLRVLPDSKIVPLVELFSQEELETSATYNDALVRFNGQNGLNVRLDGPGGTRIVWGIMDPVDDDGWSSCRLETIARILPHLRQYVRVRSALVEAGALGASIGALLANTGTGVVYLDRSGRVLEANDRARELLRRRDGLSDSSGALHALVLQDDRRLQELLARAMPRFGNTSAGGSMLIARPRRPRLVLHVEPVADPEQDALPQRVAALLLIVDPVYRARIDPVPIQDALGLSPAEARIAVLIAEGQTPRQIAAATSRGYGTVRTHLKHMYAKLGVSRQLEVAQIVLALASLPVPRDQGSAGD